MELLKYGDKRLLAECSEITDFDNTEYYQAIVDKMKKFV